MAFLPGDCFMRKNVLTHGPTGTGPSVIRAAVSGVRAKPEVQSAADLDPSTAPTFAAPYSGPAPLAVNLNAYPTGDVFMNPNGGTVNVFNFIVWNPTP